MALLSALHKQHPNQYNESGRVGLCTMRSVPQITDPRGNIGVVEANRDIPFIVKRVYYSYGTPREVVRGGHAHKNLHQFIIAIAGSFNIVLDDGSDKTFVALKNRDQGLYVCPMIWRDISDFSPDAVCLVLASEHYDESDYIRDYQEFLELASSTGI